MFFQNGRFVDAKRSVPAERYIRPVYVLGQAGFTGRIRRTLRVRTAILRSRIVGIVGVFGNDAVLGRAVVATAAAVHGRPRPGSGTLTFDSAIRFRVGFLFAVERIRFGAAAETLPHRCLIGSRRRRITFGGEGGAELFVGLRSFRSVQAYLGSLAFESVVGAGSCVLVGFGTLLGRISEAYGYFG